MRNRNTLKKAALLQKAAHAQTRDPLAEGRSLFIEDCELMLITIANELSAAVGGKPVWDDPERFARMNPSAWCFEFVAMNWAEFRPRIIPRHRQFALEGFNESFMTNAAPMRRQLEMIYPQIKGHRSWKDALK